MLQKKEEYERLKLKEQQKTLTNHEMLVLEVLTREQPPEVDLKDE